MDHNLKLMFHHLSSADVECGGCVKGFVIRGEAKVPHVDCKGTGVRINKNWGRPVKAKSRIGHSSPWTSGSSNVKTTKKK